MRPEAATRLIWLLSILLLPLLTIQFWWLASQPLEQTGRLAISTAEPDRWFDRHSSLIWLARYGALRAGGVITDTGPTEWQQLMSNRQARPTRNDIEENNWRQLPADEPLQRQSVAMSWRLRHEGKWLDHLAELAWTIPGIKQLDQCELTLIQHPEAGLEIHCQLIVQTVRPYSSAAGDEL
jgi:hypothetical protein